ncbi:MAG TPA: 30S ribosomal protein S6 [Candidatus Saccharimonadales bacterium]|nr:30S ribosomal protein S6 [Candidatus Saccharimonadales bacterium]
MFRYEILFLTVPEITKDETEAIKNHFSKVVRAHKGTLISFDRWGKYRLAYPVNHNDYGVYFLTRFEVENAEKVQLLAALKDIFVFKFNTLIVKHIFQRLDINASLEYRRPDSLEDAPQDVDTFLKRNDMEGLIKKGPARKNYEGKEKNQDFDLAEGDDFADVQS